MELKINIDTKSVAAQMVVCMIQNLHNSVVTYAHQKFGAINPQAGPFPFPTHMSGPFPGMFPNPLFPNPLFPPMQHGLGGIPFPAQCPGVPADHPYAQFGAPPAPFGSPEHHPKSAFARGQQQSGHPVFGQKAVKKDQPPNYKILLEELSKNPELIAQVESILEMHLSEFVNHTLPKNV